MSIKRKTYTDEFKKQIVALYENGKPTRDLVQEYGISPAAVYKWVKEYRNSGSFRAADNRTPEENRILELEKELKQLRMENDILKLVSVCNG